MIDESYGGLALTDEGERCAELLANPDHKTMIMEVTTGVMVLGETGVADASTTADCSRHLLKRAARGYIQALQTGQPLRVLSDEVAEKTARQLDAYPSQGDRHLSEILAILGPALRT